MSADGTHDGHARRNLKAPTLRAHRNHTHHRLNTSDANLSGEESAGGSPDLSDPNPGIQRQATGVRAFKYQPKCPILVVAERRLPVNQGFGARTQFLMWAADVAMKIGAVLAVDDRYWSHGNMHQYHFGNDFRWAWQLFPFPHASDAVRTAPMGMTQPVRTLSVDTLLKSWRCNAVYKLQAGSLWSCNALNRWCYDRLPGALDRTTSAVSASPTAALRHMQVDRANLFNVSEKALAVWHIRTGDIVLPLRFAAGAKLKQLIDSSFPRRGVRHVVVTYRKAAVHAAFPWLKIELGIHEVFDELSLKDADAFEMMLGAQVLVSTGSSFAHIPPALAEAGRQVHLYMAPKSVHELRDDGVCCIVASCDCEEPLQKPFAVVHPTMNCTATPMPPKATATAAGKADWKAVHIDNFNYRTRTNGIWMGSFVRKNTIPVTCSGDIYSEYRYKLRELAAGIDSELGSAEPAIANLAYEGWMA